MKVMGVKFNTAEPSPLMTKLIGQINKLRDARGLTVHKAMARAGLSPSMWSKWQNGSSPQLDSLESVARALDAELLVDVQDKRTPRQSIPDGISPEAVEVVALVDSLDGQARVRVLEAIHRLVRTFR